jgi:hypothetical protein
MPKRIYTVERGMLQEPDVKVDLGRSRKSLPGERRALGQHSFPEGVELCSDVFR